MERGGGREKRRLASQSGTEKLFVQELGLVEFNLNASNGTGMAIGSISCHTL